MSTTENIKDELENLAENKRLTAMKQLLITINPVDLAEILSEISPRYLLLVFRILPKENAAETFVEMDGDLQKLLIQGFSDSELGEIVNELYADDAADLIEEMPANVVKRILREADPDMRKILNELLKYPEDTAGSIMTVEYMALSENMTADDAIHKIRDIGADKETVNTCYITDSQNHLIGALDLSSLILAPISTVLSQIMDNSPIFVYTNDDQEETADLFTKYGLEALPVVDSDKRLVGIVTVDDAMDIMRQEATEDMEIMAAINPSEKPYIKMSVISLFKNRIPWLLLLMISATVTGMIITKFESALSACVLLTAYIPMLMDSGGNCGSQASVTIIRALSLGELKLGDILRVMWKEARVAVLCGITLAAVNFLKLLILDRVTVPIALTICITLALTVFVAKIVGCSLPMLAKRIGLDPAVMASPFITTIVDALSLLIYFTFATIILGL